MVLRGVCPTSTGHVVGGVDRSTLALSIYRSKGKRRAIPTERAPGRSFLGRHAGRSVTFRTRLEIEVSRQNQEERRRRRRDENWSGFMVARHTIAMAMTVLLHAVAGNGQKRKNERMIQNATATTAR